MLASMKRKSPFPSFLDTPSHFESAGCKRRRVSLDFSEDPKFALCLTRHAFASPASDFDIRRIRFEGPTPLPRSSRWQVRDPRGGLFCDVEPMLIAVFCPRFSSRGFGPLKRFRIGPTPNQGTHTNVVSVGLSTLPRSLRRQPHDHCRKTRLAVRRRRHFEKSSLSKCPFSTFGLRHVLAMQAPELDIACESALSTHRSYDHVLIAPKIKPPNSMLAKLCI